MVALRKNKQETDRPVLAVFASGNGSNFQALDEAVQAGRLHAQIGLVVCDQPGAYVIERAKRAGVPILIVKASSFKTKLAYEQTILQHLHYYGVDLIVLAGYMRIITLTLLQAFPSRIVNIHPSLLPLFPGKQGILDAYEAGISETGVTVHIVDEGVDTGPILAQGTVAVQPEDSLASLSEKIHRLEHELYPKAIQSYLQEIGGEA